MTRLVAELIGKSKNMDLKKPAKQERCPRMKTRLQALYLLTTGMNQKKVAETTLTTPLSLRRWTAAFIVEGVGGLRDKPGCGRKRKLSKTDEKSDTRKIGKADVFLPMFSWSFLVGETSIYITEIHCRLEETSRGSQGWVRYSQRRSTIFA